MPALSVLHRGRGRSRVFGSASTLALALAAALAGALSPAHGQGAPLPEGVSCSTVMVPMRDGVKLFTEVYRPTKPGKYPVVLQRTPYTMNVGVKGCTTPSPFPVSPASDLMRDYVVVVQESRGTSRSEGDGQFRPMVIEAKDGYDAVEWAARQPWSTGKVGMIGGSYGGVVQWQAAIARPPHLVTIIPNIAPTNGDQSWPYLNGVFNQALAQVWTSGVGAGQLQRKLVAEGASPERVNAELAAWRSRALRAAYRSPREMLPLGSDPIFNNDLGPWYKEWVGHPITDPHWAASNASAKFDTLSIPVLSLGAFYDLFIHGTIDGYTGMHERAATPEARANARMVIAGGGHAGLGTHPYIGQLTFGAENDFPQDLTKRWLDHWLKGIDNGVMNEPPVKMFVMLPPDRGSSGSGFWVSGSSYPLPGTQTVRYYLDGGAASTPTITTGLFVDARGVLSANPAADAGSDQYRYDPANPVPAIGGAWCCGGRPGGAFDQRPVEDRPDVLVYTSGVLKEALPVIGEPTVTLVASSTAPSTAFTAKLVDVHLDGYAQIIADGIVETPAAKPNAPATYTIKMNETGTVFKPGHRIRLEISSSNYPRFNAHTNTTAPLASAKEMVTATQTISWNGTSLNLPVAPISIPKNVTP